MPQKQTGIKVRNPTKELVTTLNTVLCGGVLAQVDVGNDLGVAVHGKIHNALRCGGGLADVCDGGGHNLEEDHKGLA